MLTFYAASLCKETHDIIDEVIEHRWINITLAYFLIFLFKLTAYIVLVLLKTRIIFKENSVPFGYCIMIFSIVIFGIYGNERRQKTMEDHFIFSFFLLRKFPQHLIEIVETLTQEAQIVIFRCSEAPDYILAHPINQGD